MVIISITHSLGPAERIITRIEYSWLPPAAIAAAAELSKSPRDYLTSSVSQIRSLVYIACD